MEITVLAAVAAFLVVVILVVVYLSIRVVQQYEKMVVFRLGRTNETMVRDPGLRFLVPIIDRPVKVGEQPELWISLDLLRSQRDGWLAGSVGIGDEAGQDMDHGVDDRPVA